MLQITLESSKIDKKRQRKHQNSEKSLQIAFSLKITIAVRVYRYCQNANKLNQKRIVATDYLESSRIEKEHQ